MRTVCGKHQEKDWGTTHQKNLSVRILSRGHQKWTYKTVFRQATEMLQLPNDIKTRLPIISNPVLCINKYSVEATVI
jgi:hypothetical protein